MLDICNRIRAFMRWNGIEHKEVAEKIFVSKKVITSVLNGRTKLDLDRYIELCNVLHVPVTFFFDGGGWEAIPEYIFLNMGVDKNEALHTV